MKPSLALAATLILAGLTACAPETDADRASKAKGTDVAADGGTGMDKVRTRMQKYLPDIKAEQVRPAAAPGLYEVQNGSYYAYVTADGKFMIQGDMVNLESGEEITENERRSSRLAKLDELGTDNMIVFSPEKAQDVKYTITVFTDVDCGFCRKLHSEMADYNKEGIAVRYVFYPRTGPDSPSFQKAEQVWCAPDRKAALTIAKLGAPVAAPDSCPNPVLREWKLGEEFGLRGTPMLVLQNGEIVNGYVPPPQLAQRLAEIQTASVAAADKAKAAGG